MNRGDLKRLLGRQVLRKVPDFDLRVSDDNMAQWLLPKIVIPQYKYTAERRNRSEFASAF
jgi:hypothetical protein